MTTRHQPRHHTRRPASPSAPVVCPFCGATAVGQGSAARMREELSTAWWSAAGSTSSGPAAGGVLVTRHCGHCQPHTLNMHIVACLVCGDGPILIGPLAQAVSNSDPQQLPTTVVDQLATTGWRWAETPYGVGWICQDHPRLPASDRPGVRR